MKGSVYSYSDVLYHSSQKNIPVPSGAYATAASLTGGIVKIILLHHQGCCLQV